MVISLIGVTAGFSLFAQENNLIKDSSKSEIIIKLKSASKYFSAPSNSTDYSNQKLIANRSAEKLFQNISNKNTKFMAAPASGANNLAEIYKIKLSPNEKIENVIADIKNNPDIEYAEPNISLELQDVPNDKYFELQWGLRNTGQSIASISGSCGADIKAEDAWAICKGTSGIIIALIDTGIDYSHPDLAKNIWINIREIPGNGIDEDNNGYTDDFRGWSFFDQNDNVMDTNSHGTHCAGIIAAEANNGIGIAGVCWNAKIMPLKVFTNNSNYTNAETCARAILYAVDNGAKIISASWGSTNDSSLLNDAIKYANDRGVVMVFAAGNNNSSQAYYPAANPLVISVGSTDNKDIKASFSNCGDWIDVFAPGVDIYSTCPNNTYGLKSGTSSSCPFVAGLAGLILSKYPNLSPLEVKQNIKEKADWIGFANNNLAKRRVNAFKSLLFSQSNFCIGQEGGSIELPDGTRLDFPAGLTSDKLFIYMGELNSNSYDILKANNCGAINGIVFPIGNFNLIRYFAASSAGTGQNICNFGNYFTVSIPYPDSNNSGFIDGTNIPAKNLKLCYLDQDKMKWVILHNSIVDTAKKTVSAQVNHFSIFGIFQATQAQDSSEIIAYPNPLYSTKDAVMKFGRIPLNMPDIKIIIFNVAGELVKTLSEGTEIKTFGTEKCAEWNATNNSGEKVASGVYIYVVKSGDSKQKSGKIAVLR